ncbi:hypothetical protein E2K80_10335 [Rhodophyticola sp. CCM32]|uniref:DUF2161 domain-containing phosphodiesterase n=1 Tax=Rhodophyticola sp. CCM32 TaxID=2916397 RepID=UPI00107F7CF5|nr:DUF2161 domain-containing phosphodiesterase [Rhodophyticola sp. CCM32]QBY01076.1 hypothetical protein E2K80_10335 [Rhodophyticola sp. CCM32]
MVKETDLYPPVKAFLEAQGYEVKAEIAGADVVAQRGAEEPVIVELKTRFSLALFHQGVARLGVSDLVYLAVPRGSGRMFQKSLTENVKLARRLGLGLLTVRLKDGFVEAHCDPGPYAPRHSKPRKARLLREFARRVGDPNAGGTRGGIVTAYRQDALRCARHLAAHGPCKGAAVKAATGVERATTLMRDDHYGWFERVETGIYRLTPKGGEALTVYPGEEGG